MGNETAIACILFMKKGAETFPAGNYTIHDINDKQDLLSVSTKKLHPEIRPPSGYYAYPLPGSTTVECSFETVYGQRFTGQLEVQIKGSCLLV